MDCKNLATHLLTQSLVAECEKNTNIWMHKLSTHEYYVVKKKYTLFWKEKRKIFCDNITTSRNFLLTIILFWWSKDLCGVFSVHSMNKMYLLKIEIQVT